MHISRYQVRLSSQARASIVIVAVASFGLGLGTAFFTLRSKHSPAPGATVPETNRLSDATLRALEGLPAPVQVRFYRVFDPVSVPESTRQFASRADALLSEYQKRSGGKVTLVRHSQLTPEASASASADRIVAFNRDQGEPCLLGIGISSGARSESLPMLTAQWEPALEADLTRALVRVATVPPTNVEEKTPATLDPALVDYVKRTVPNFETVGAAEGGKLLRIKALESFKAAAKELETKTEDAQRRLADAIKNGSEQEQKSILEEIRRIQVEQTEKLKAIAAQTQEQVTTLEQLKAKQQTN